MSFSALRMFVPYSGAASAVGGAGNGAANRIAIWADGSNLTSYNNFVVDSSGRMALSAATDAGSALLISNGTSLSGTAQNGLYVFTQFNSNANNGSGYGVYSQPRTAATAFTLSRMAGFFSDVPTVGSGSSVTRFANYWAQETTSASSNAILTDDTAFTAGNWAIFLKSTNPSRLAGQLRVASLGVGNAVAATTPGSVVKKLEFFDQSGVSIGFAPIYNTIT